MKHVFVAIVAIAIATHPVQGQDEPAAPVARKAEVKTSYDKFRDRSTVTLERFEFGRTVPLGMGVNGKELGLILTASAPGQKMSLPDSVQFRFVVFSMRTSGRSQYWPYRMEHDLIVLVDDSTRLTFPAVRYDTTHLESNAVENIYFTVPVDAARRISGARKVEALLGKREIAWSDEQLRALRAFLTAASVPN